MAVAASPLADALAVRLSAHVPDDHRPHPAQHAFLALTVPEALYGGAAGGGKSDAMLMAASQYVDVRDYAALLLRKTYQDLALPGALMDRAKQWWYGQPGIRWDDETHTFTFPGGGRITFGYLHTKDAHFRYQGAEFQFIGVDELTQIPMHQYRYLLSRLRRPDDLETGHPLAGVPLRARSASNPGGIGHEWGTQRFVDKVVLSTLEQDDPNYDPEDTPARAARRLFIPARLADNPSVDYAAYLEQLAGLDPQTRAQLLDGDWNARPPGSYVYPIGIEEAVALGARWDALYAAGKLPPPAGQALALGIDWGIATTAILLIWPMAGGGVYVPPGEIFKERGEPADLTRRALDMAAGYDVAPLTEARYDAAGAQQMETFLTVAPGSVGGYRVDFNIRKDRTIAFIRQLLNRTAEGRDTRVIGISPRNRRLIQQLRGLQFDDKGKVVKEDDHGPDALIAGVWPIAAEFPDLSRPGQG